MLRAFLTALCVFGAAARAVEPPASGSARAGVESALSSIREAVLAGDASAFLARVDLSEARLATEMRHWAEDLAKHHPFEFAATVADEGAAFEESRAVCRVWFTWKIAVDENGREIAPDKAVERRAGFPPIVFTRSADGRWLWSGEDWLTLEGDGFVVKYLTGDEEIAREVRGAFPVARKHVDRGFEIAGTAPQTIKLYADMDHLKATVYLSMPDPYLGGWNEPGESIKFMRNYTKGRERWVRAFAHEYGHAATWELGPGARDLPWWMQEGVAELAAEEFDEGKGGANDRQMQRFARRGRVAPWEKIADYDTCEQPLKYLAYVQGHHFMGYLSDRFGRAQRNRWLRALCAGAALDDGCRSVLGSGFEELSGAWRATLPPASETEAESPK